MKICIVGATAYTSRELIGILLHHPEAKIVHLGGRREGNPRISEIFPSLRGRCDMKMGGLEVDTLEEKPDIAFFTLPHQVSQKYVPSYLEAGIRCIDFSADYRLKDVNVYQKHYGEHLDPGNIPEAVYGIPELFGEKLPGARLIANPGCYPTSVILGLAPLAREGLVESERIIVDAKSGVSGRGNKPNRGSMYCVCNEDMTAYKVGVHRHEPEMEQGLQMVGIDGADVLFVPHLAPMDRGILSTIYANLREDVNADQIQDLYDDFYSACPFVRVMGEGEQPHTKAVSGTNCCDIGLTKPRRSRVVVTSAIDNLMRGASSQAVQNMNVAEGIDETAGLL